MKTKPILAVLVFLLPIAKPAPAAIVFETTGWMTEPDALTYSFDADVTPLIYRATLSDLSAQPSYGFDSLSLSIETGTTAVGSLSSPGSFTFAAVLNETYSATVSGVPGGDLEAGLFGVEIATVPVPPAFMLLGSTLAAMVLLRKRNGRTAESKVSSGKTVPNLKRTL